MGLRGIVLHDGLPNENSCSLVSEKPESYQELEPIDWAAAAPSWTSIVGGIILPLVAIVALVFLIDAVLCWVLEQSIGYFWSMPLWLLATMGFPLALIGAIAAARSFHSSADWIVSKSKAIL
jgi:hypothetical protein